MKFQRNILYFLFAALIVIIAFVAYAYDNHRKNVEASFWVNHTNEVIKHIERVYSTTSQIESGSRGYVISGNKSFAGLCNTAAESVNRELGAIKELTLDNAFQQKNTDLLTQLVDRKVSYSCRVISLRDQSASSALQLVSRGYGKQLMDSIKDRVNIMLREENRLLTERIMANQKSERRAFEIALFGSICTLIFLIPFLYRLNRDIQLRKKAEADTRISEAKYRRLIEDAGVVMFTTDTGGDFTFISDRVKTLTGFRKEELLGQSYAALVSPDWLDRVRSHYQLQLKERKPESILEFPIITKEKTSKWVEQTGVIQYGDNGKIAGMQFIVKDIDEKKHAREELEKAELEREENQERLQSILDNSTSLVYMKDLQGRYLLINKKFESVFQTSNQYLRGRTDFELHEKPAADRYSEVDRWVIENKKPREVEEILTQPDGDHHYMIVKFPLYNIHHEVYGLCGIATDISDRIRYEEELVEARRIAENAERLQEQFLANMSHDIRTPLNGIAGMTALLSGTRLNDEQREFTNGIKQSADALMILINDILDLSKIKAGKLDIESIHFSLPDVTARALYSLKQRALEKGLRFSVTIDRAIPRILKGDPYRLSQILINLTGNAIKFTDHGEIALTAAAGNISGDRMSIRFNVRDTGIGIPADKLDTIFESFAQSSSDTARKYGGTGLGLSIVRQLVQLQEGEIHMDSVLHQGSDFGFTIPYIIPADSDEQSAPYAGRAEDSGAGELKGYRILVAEDDSINQKMIGHILKRAGVCADITSTGKELIERLQAGNRYDLILSDVHMPEMDGYAAARFIRQVLGLDIPILAMTATILKGEKNLCIESGMNDYIPKPFSTGELIEKIRKHVPTIQPPADLSPAGLSESRGGSLYDLSYLEELQDPEYMKEILDIFLANAPRTLEEIKTAAQQREWQNVCRKAHQLKGTLGMLKMQPLVAVLLNIENNAREDKQTDLIPDLIEKAIAFYGKVHPLLEEEKNKL